MGLSGPRWTLGGPKVGLGRPMKAQVDLRWD